MSVSELRHLIEEAIPAWVLFIPLILYILLQFYLKVIYKDPLQKALDQMKKDRGIK